MIKQRIQKTEIIEKAKKLFNTIGRYGTRCIYESRYCTFQIHYCLKSECDLNQFILSTLRYWSSFVYDEDIEFIEDLEQCQFINVSIVEAEKHYNLMKDPLLKCRELHQIPPSFIDFDKIENAYLISDIWNYRSIVLITDKVYIGCHWDTAE